MSLKQQRLLAARLYKYKAFRKRLSVHISCISVSNKVVKLSVAGLGDAPVKLRYVKPQNHLG